MNSTKEEGVSNTLKRYSTVGINTLSWFSVLCMASCRMQNSLLAQQLDEPSPPPPHPTPPCHPTTHRGIDSSSFKMMIL